MEEEKDVREVWQSKPTFYLMDAEVYYRVMWKVWDKDEGEYKYEKTTDSFLSPKEFLKCDDAIRYCQEIALKVIKGDMVDEDALVVQIRAKCDENYATDEEYTFCKTEAEDTEDEHLTICTYYGARFKTKAVVKKIRERITGVAE